MLSESEFFADRIDLLCVLADIPVIQFAVFAVSEIVISIFAADNRPFGKLPNHGFLLKYHLFVANSLPLNHGIDQHRSQPSRQSRHSFTILPAPYRRALYFIIPYIVVIFNGLPQIETGHFSHGTCGGSFGLACPSSISLPYRRRACSDSWMPMRRSAVQRRRETHSPQALRSAPRS